MIGTVTMVEGIDEVTFTHSAAAVAVEITSDGWLTTSVGHSRMDVGAAQALAETLTAAVEHLKAVR